MGASFFFLFFFVLIHQVLENCSNLNIYFGFHHRIYDTNLLFILLLFLFPFQLLVFCFFFFCLCQAYLAWRRLSPVVSVGGYSVAMLELLLQQNTGSRHVGFSGYSMQVQQLWYTGLVAPQQVESSLTRDRTLSTALAGGFPTTVPPGKSCLKF